MTGPAAPHLSQREREWWEVAVREYARVRRPRNTGGVWILAQGIRFVRPVPHKCGGRYVDRRYVS